MSTPRCIICGREFRKYRTMDRHCSQTCVNISIKRKAQVKQKKRIAPFTEKRLAQYREYKIHRDIFMSLDENKYCPVMKHLKGVLVRTTDLHHMNGRNGDRLLDQKYWLAVSREGHDWIGLNTTKARELGWLV